ncbi:MAG: ATP-grasp domain-containing protein [Symbiobacteriaceae bacterium]|nr:ATP-grasp domain-containing protein [Symbiobacteriaceae bacterium]
MKILFTGGRAPATLELARNFGRQGWEVHVADNISPVLPEFSRYTKAYHLIHSPRFAETLFVADLIQIILKHNIDVLFPTCEEIFWVSKNKRQIQESCEARILCDDLEKLALLHNKYRFMMFAREEGILAPETDLWTGVNILGRKSVIKPIFSRFGEDVTILEAGENVYDERTHNILQEYIEGESVCSYGFADKGSLKFNVCYRSPLKTHTAFTAFDPLICSTIDEIVSGVVAKMSFTGNIAFDFIEMNGEYYVIECNPRLTSGIHTLCYNDFPQLFFGSGQEQLYLNKAQLLVPTLVTELRLLFYKDVIYDPRDLRPFSKQVSCLNLFRSRAREHGISLTKATVFDIEWNGEDMPR